MTQNPYLGVDAHLNSLLQTPGVEDQIDIWPVFHAQHIAHTADRLNKILPEHYFAFIEPSLQIRSQIINDAPYRPSESLMGANPRLSPSPRENRPIEPAKPTWRARIEDTIEPEAMMPAVIVRKVDDPSHISKPLVRIELLAPSNKRGGVNYAVYRGKRLETIYAGLVLVEIDYQHETLSPINGLPKYPHMSSASAYYIAITDPRPSMQDGYVTVYGFKVNEAIPAVPFKLDTGRVMIFDINSIYQATYTEGKWGDIVEHGREPVRFDSYSTQDRHRITQIMKRSTNGA